MIALYLRVSTGAQANDEKTSLPEQRRHGIKFAEKMGMPYEIHEDAYPGGLDDRPSFQQLKKEMAEGKYKAVWVWNYKRLARDTVIGILFYRYCRKHEVKLYEGIGKEIDNELLCVVEVAVAQRDKEDVIKRLHGAATAEILKGYKVYPNLYGYDPKWSETKQRIIEVKEDEAKIVREIFNQIIQGKPFHQIAKDLNERGVGERRWHSTTIKRIATKKIYTGCYDWNLTDQSKVIKSEVYNNRLHNTYEIVDTVKDIPSVYYPPIISKDTFRKAQRENNRACMRGNNLNLIKYNKHIGTGIFSCAYCGRSTHYASYNKENRVEGAYHYKRYGIRHRKDCKHKMTRLYVLNYEGVNTWLMLEALDFLTDEISIAKLFRKQKQELKGNKQREEEKLSDYRKQLKKLDAEKKKILKMKESLDDEDDLLIEMYQKAFKKEKDLKLRIAEIESKLALEDLKISEAISSLMQNRVESFISGTPFQQRKLLLSWILEAKVKDNELYIKWITHRESRLTYGNKAWWSRYITGRIEERKNEFLKEKETDLTPSNLYKKYLMSTGVSVNEVGTIEFNPQNSTQLPELNQEQLKEVQG